MKRIAILAAGVLASCGEPPLPPATIRPDASVLNRCEGVLCLPGESCEPSLGCFCTEDGCPAPAVCNESGRCENLCASSSCAQGERCVPNTGVCECGSLTDPCAEEMFCNEETKRCDTRCTSQGCPRGERCEPSSGQCRCADCGAEGLGCDPTTNRCVNRCPASCSAGERCDDPVVGECHCTDTSCASHQVCDASRRCVDLCQGKACNPGERCDSNTGHCVCDQCGPRDRCNPVTQRCESRCSGVTCDEGEACVETSGECRCSINPNSCPAGMKCRLADFACVPMCDGVTCAVPGEHCNPTSAGCVCDSAPADTCAFADPSSRCDASSMRCVARCLGVSCAPGESCSPVTGTCQCQSAPTDSCAVASSSLRCNPGLLRCEEKCSGTSCPLGEACVATSGECHCGIPNTCPQGKKCDASLLTCVGLCQGVTCTARGELCDPSTGSCACTAAPDSCTPADSSMRCDPLSRRCISQCQGIACAPGEICSATSGRCECAASPVDTCTDPTTRCNATSLHCEPKCDGVTCGQGEACLETSGACACGLSPNTCPPGRKCDAGTRHCVGLCTGVLCAVPGETCDPATGLCSCSAGPDTCSGADPTTRCDPARRCVPKCQGVFCGPGESCVPATGVCACAPAPDSCSSADATLRCNAQRVCAPKCLGMSCPSGETCVPSSGECHCGLPNTCPASQRCETSTLHCVPACQGVSCSSPGESCAPATGACQCQATPSDTCTASLATTRCDTGSLRCVSRCAGVSCQPGEACDSGSATCRCSASPDSCAAVSSAHRCDGSTLRCVLLCSGVSCTAGETCNPANGACECSAESCLANYACSVATRHCVACAQETDGQFCARQLRECGSLSGLDNCGRSRAASCGACVSPEECSAAGLCLLPGGPVNDECIGAQPLVFDGSGLAHLSGDTARALDSGRAAVCGVGFGNDVVYSFTTGGVKNVDITLSYSGIQTPVLYVRRVCASPASADELACDSGSSGGPVSVALANLPAGTYYLWVDAFSGDSGSFTLDVQLSDPPPVPGNDRCDTPSVLSFAGGGTASVTGDTRSATNDYSGTCGSMTGGEVVYAVDLASQRSLTATVTRDPATPTFHPAVYLRKVCLSADAADESGCGVEASGAASLTSASVGPGRVYVVVDGLSGSGGRFSLQVSLADPWVVPANETCASASSLTLSASGTASVTATTRHAANDGGGACAGTGPDLVWTVTTAQVASITARVIPAAGSSDYRPVVYLRSGACSGAGSVEAACSSAAGPGQVASATAVNASAGTWWVWVDGFAGSKGEFTLEVTLVPSNDKCAAAQTLVAATTYPGNSSFAVADYVGAKTAFSAACQSSNFGARGPDVVYAYTPGAAGNVTVSVTPAPGSNYDPLVWVINSPCVTFAPACLVYADAGSYNAAETVTFAGSAGTTYYFIVGSYYATGAYSAGPFSIAVTGP
ncbi:MAG: hypothetical protein HY901_32350 [Deltaproteobacteria bacterium]|nr:hypothetical protein [Deltaproteobacteria bacterium]